MDVATCGDHMRCGYSRCGVYRDLFDQLVQSLESLGAPSCDATRRALQLDSPADSTTGWYTKSYNESDVEGVLIPKGATSLAVAAGTYARENYTWLTADPFTDGDQLLLEGNYYEVKTVNPHRIADSFSHYECALTNLPFHETYTSSITAPSVEDARYRTKDYWDTYISSSNLNDRGFLVCYDKPDYPLYKVLHEKGMDIIFAISNPESTPILSGDLVPRRYREHVPTHVLTVDKINASGTELQWLAEAELRKVTEDHPTGSQRPLERMGPTEVHELGSTRLYDTTYMLDYYRRLT